MTKRQQRRRVKQRRHRQNDPMVQYLDEVEDEDGFATELNPPNLPWIVRVFSAMHRAVRVW